MDERLLELVGLIYDAALDSELWPVFLEKFSNVFGASGAVFYLENLDHHRVDFITSARIDSSALQLYGEHYAAQDIWVQQAMSLPPGTVVSSPMLLPNDKFIRSEFYNDFLQREDIFHLCSAIVEHKQSSWAAVSLYRPRPSEDFGADERKKFELIVPHLQRAVQIHKQFATLDSKRDLSEQVLDNLSIGIILLDGGGQIIAMNRNAEEIVARNDGLMAGRTCLHTATRQQTDELRKLILEAAQTGAGRGMGAGGAMVVSRPSTNRPLSVLVMPLRSRVLGWGTELPVVALFFTDPERNPELPVEALSRLYGLTPAEARLAASFVKTTSLKKSAEVLGITEGTARQYLKRIFQKTDTKSQVELMKLMLSEPAAMLSR